MSSHPVTLHVELQFESGEKLAIIMDECPLCRSRKVADIQWANAMMWRSQVPEGGIVSTTAEPLPRVCKGFYPRPLEGSPFARKVCEIVSNHYRVLTFVAYRRLETRSSL